MKKITTNRNISSSQNGTSTRKLRLARETLRRLSAPELLLAAGGTDDTRWPCTTTKDDDDAILG